MKQIEVFPFTRDGYHYDVQPRYAPKWKHHANGMQTQLTAPKELDYLTVYGRDMPECEKRMQDFIHEVSLSLDRFLGWGFLNKSGQRLCESFRNHLIITNP